MKKRANPDRGIMTFRSMPAYGNGFPEIDPDRKESDFTLSLPTETVFNALGTRNLAVTVR